MNQCSAKQGNSQKNTLKAVHLGQRSPLSPRNMDIKIGACKATGAIFLSGFILCFAMKVWRKVSETIVDHSDLQFLALLGSVHKITTGPSVGQFFLGGK